MIKILQYFIFLLTFIFLNNCSLDKKSGIWTGYEEEIKRIAELERENEGLSEFKIFSTSDTFIKEMAATQVANLSIPKKNTSWPMSRLNLQNSIGNLHLRSIKNKFLKKKVGGDKFNIFQKMHSPLSFQNKIVLSDDKGSIFKINKRGKVYWKNNIYKKIYKNLYKNLTFTFYNDNIYVADNIGFIYVINYQNGKVIWKKNFGIPFKSNIKVFDNKIFIIDQDNRVLCLDIKNGSKIWNVRTTKTFIKSQNLLGLAISEKGSLVTINSAGDVFKINSKNGNIHWAMSSLISLSEYDSDFFRTSDVVINDENIIFSNNLATFSMDLVNGHINWVAKLSSNSTPIVDDENVFLITERGYFINLDRKTGKLIWATNILKILKKKKQQTSISGFVLGSNKIYATTLNGYLIVCSATTGKVEYHDKIAKAINAAPVISDGELYILTAHSKIIGFK